MKALLSGVWGWLRGDSVWARALRGMFWFALFVLQVEPAIPRDRETQLELLAIGSTLFGPWIVVLASRARLRTLSRLNAVLVQAAIFLVPAPTILLAWGRRDMLKLYALGYGLAGIAFLGANILTILEQRLDCPFSLPDLDQVRPEQPKKPVTPANLRLFLMASTLWALRRAGPVLLVLIAMGITHIGMHLETSLYFSNFLAIGFFVYAFTFIPAGFYQFFEHDQPILATALVCPPALASLVWLATTTFGLNIREEGIIYALLFVCVAVPAVYYTLFTWKWPDYTPRPGQGKDA